ncbi:MAG: PA14 domain-containing protein [Chitinophagaceae bacterium]
MYTTAHGPQPISKGNTYFVNDSTVAWIVTANGTSGTPAVIYKGHTVLDNKVSLRYELIYQGKRIKVEERPEFFTLADGQVGFERVFKTTDIPDGVELGLKMHIESITSDKDIATDNKFVICKSAAQDISGKTYKTIDGILSLKNNAVTNFSVSITPKPFTDVVKTAAPKVVNEREERVFALMTKSDCNTCHNRDLKTIGPSFRTIAQRYPNSPKISTMLSDKIIRGGKGSWGEVPMTPHPLVAKEDVAAMVSYILDLDATQENRERATMPVSDYLFEFKKKSTFSNAKTQVEKPGLALNIYKLADGFTGTPEISAKTAPQLSGVANMLHLSNFDFGFNMEEFRGNFALIASGSLNLKKTTNAVFRVVGSDVSKLFIDNKLVLENTGGQNEVPKEGELNNLKPGKHPIRIEYF